LNDLCLIERGASPRPIKDFITTEENGINWIKIGDAEEGSQYITKTEEKITKAGAEKSRRVYPGDFLLSNSMSFGRPYILKIEGCVHDGWLILRPKDQNRIDKNFLYYILGSSNVYKQFKNLATGGVVNNLNSKLVSGVKIPLPPLSVQQEIVEELNHYQKVIDGAKQVVENYQPSFETKNDWSWKSLGDVCTTFSGGTPSRDNNAYWNGSIPWVKTGEVKYETITQTEEHITEIGLKESSAKLAEPGTILLALYGQGITRGRVAMLGIKAAMNQACLAIEPSNVLDNKFLFYVLQNSYLKLRSMSIGGNQSNLSANLVQQLQIPVPPIEVQRSIVEQLNKEKEKIDQISSLIGIFENKIKSRIDSIWGD
jgi:restriction endonuclease S subunit